MIHVETKSSLTMSQHAAAMDRIYRRQRYIYDITRRYYLLGRNRMLASLLPPPHGTVLEIGCGTARNLIQAAGLYPSASFYGFDISAEMLKTAAQSIAASRHVDRIVVTQGDAVTFNAQDMFGVSQFDRIFISYSLSMIPAWEAIIDRSVHHLAPGGALHVVDFGRMDRMPGPARRAMLSWLTRFSVTPRRDLEETVRRIAGRNSLHLEFTDGHFGYWAAAVLTRR